jgi:hypothetical protein
MGTSKLTPRQKMRSSPEARRIIRAYIKRYGTEREAARHLHMTHGQLNKLKRGTLHDTRAIKTAIDRANSRAQRAWLRIDEDVPHWIDSPATLRAARRAIEQSLVMIDAILKQHGRTT